MSTDSWVKFSDRLETAAGEPKGGLRVTARRDFPGRPWAVEGTWTYPRLRRGYQTSRFADTEAATGPLACLCRYS